MIAPLNNHIPPRRAARLPSSSSSKSTTSDASRFPALQPARPRTSSALTRSRSRLSLRMMASAKGNSNGVAVGTAAAAAAAAIRAPPERLKSNTLASVLEKTWEAGDLVCRELDGMWFPALVLRKRFPNKYDVKYSDDGNVEIGVESSELRARLADTPSIIPKEAVSNNGLCRYLSRCGQSRLVGEDLAWEAWSHRKEYESELAGGAVAESKDDDEYDAERVANGVEIDHLLGRDRNSARFREALSSIKDEELQEEGQKRVDGEAQGTCDATTSTTTKQSARADVGKETCAEPEETQKQESQAEEKCFIPHECPICFEIMISPVQLPCHTSHIVCRLCLHNLENVARGRCVNSDFQECKALQLLRKNSFKTKDLLKIQKLYSKKSEKRRQNRHSKKVLKKISCPLCRANISEDFLSKHKADDEQAILSRVYKLLYVPMVTKRENVIWFELSSHAWDDVSHGVNFRVGDYVQGRIQGDEMQGMVRGAYGLRNVVARRGHVKRRKAGSNKYEVCFVSVVAGFETEVGTIENPVPAAGTHQVCLKLSSDVFRTNQHGETDIDRIAATRFIKCVTFNVRGLTIRRQAPPYWISTQSGAKVHAEIEWSPSMKNLGLGGTISIPQQFDGGKKSVRFGLPLTLKQSRQIREVISRIPKVAAHAARTRRTISTAKVHIGSRIEVGDGAFFSRKRRKRRKMGYS